MNEMCQHHEAMNEKLKRYDKHCDESDEPKTGYRDRLVNVEVEVKSIRAGVYKAAIVGGIIGALIGQTSPDLIQWVFKKILGA